jgi:hypothetical protein
MILFGSLFISIVSSAQCTKPAIVSAAQWGSKPEPIADSRKQTPVWITVHHAGELWTGKTDPADFVRTMQAWGQKEKHWPDLPYHFLIAPDGRIFEGRPVQYEPDTNTKYPVNGNIGIELFGNFEVQRPSVEQLQSCVKLVAWLAQENRIDQDHIRGHKDAAQGQTVCPGKDFYRYMADGTFRKWVEATMRGESPQVQEGEPLAGGPTERIPTTRPTSQP